MEFSGLVLKAPTALPDGKTPAFKKGDKVFGGNQGAYATHITCTEDMLKPVPEGWSYEDAAGMFVTGPTSYGGLVVRAGVKEGMLSPLTYFPPFNNPMKRRLGTRPRSSRRCRPSRRPNRQGLWCDRHRNSRYLPQTRRSPLLRCRLRRQLPR